MNQARRKNKRLFKPNKQATIFAGIILLLLPISVVAQDLSLGLEYGSATGLGSSDLRSVVVAIIRILFGLLGLAALGIILYAGYVWQTSGGDEEKIGQAKKILKNGVIGLVIILSAYAITEFIIKQITTAIYGNGNGPGVISEGGGGGTVLGGGIIQMVYPAPGATGVPRNTMIMVAFKQAVNKETIIDNNNDGCPANLPPNVVCGHVKEVGNSPVIKIIGDNNLVSSSNLIAIISADNKQLVVDPQILLGSAQKTVNYQVTLTDNIKKVDGKQIFFAGGFHWDFTTSTAIDSQPPFIVSVQPKINSPATAANIVVQVNFNEPINAVAASGEVQVNNGVIVSGSWQNAYLVKNTNNEVIGGQWEISNNFKTLEFIPKTPCVLPVGQTTNSCGKVPYCLPKQTQLRALIKAALVDDNGSTIDVLSGLSDAAGNSLDGGGLNGLNKDSRSSGRPTDGQNQFSADIMNDNYFWSLATSDEIDLTPPIIKNTSDSLTPEPGESGVPRNDDVIAGFSEPLRASTINSDNVSIFKYDCLLPNPSIANQLPTDPSCYPAYGFSTFLEDDSRVNIKIFNSGMSGLTVYNPRLTNQIQDLYQNCFNPSVGPCAGFGTLNPYCGFNGQPVMENNPAPSSNVSQNETVEAGQENVKNK
jgi:hypothetical protein